LIFSGLVPSGEVLRGLVPWGEVEREEGRREEFAKAFCTFDVEEVTKFVEEIVVDWEFVVWVFVDWVFGEGGEESVESEVEAGSGSSGNAGGRREGRGGERVSESEVLAAAG
jgi:hypothetical protein